MRWPFGRRSTPTDRATAPGSGPGTAPASARPHDTWRSLPAVQRTIGRPPVVAPAAPFADRLATRQPPELALAPLGHEVSPLASPGVLIGLVTTTEAANTGRLDLPVQRHAGEAQPAEAGTPDWSQFDTDDLAGSDGGASAVQTSPASPAPSATTGLDDAAPATVVAPVQRLAPPVPILTASSGTSVAAPPAGTFDPRPRPAGTSQPAIPAAAAAVQRAVATPAPVMPPPVDPARAPRRPTLGQARRLGLGAPLPAGPDGNVLRIAASDRGAPPVVPSTGPGADPRPPAGEPSAATASSARPATADSAPAMPAGPAPEPGTTSIAGPAQLTVVRPLSIQRLASSLAGAAPVRTEVSRAAPGAVPGDHGPGGSVEVQRLPVASGESAPSGRPVADGARASFDASDLGPPDLPGIVAEPVGRTPIRATAPGSLLDPRPAAQRATGGPLASSTGPGAPQPAVARAGSDPGRPSPSVAPVGAPAPGRAPSVQREPVGPLVPRTLAANAPGSEPYPGTGPTASSGGPAVQRAVEVRELVITTQADNRGPAGEPAGGATPGSAATPAAAGAPPSIADRDRELDELARRLYGRIRTKLAAELLADRERAGLLVDPR